MPRSINPILSTKGLLLHYTVCKCFFLVDDDRCSAATPPGALTSFTCTCIRIRILDHISTHSLLHSHTHTRSLRCIRYFDAVSSATHPRTHAHARVLLTYVGGWRTSSPCLSCCNVTPLATFTFTLLLVPLKLFAAVTTLLPHLQTSGLLGSCFFLVFELIGRDVH